mmetsp:Transcript_49331/g.105378  ORF Transcript_49331/g.105378 Transcript_49331/m.105378 type:complete len:238 (+) Transcript_49331:628-1341(+)
MHSDVWRCPKGPRTQGQLQPIARVAVKLSGEVDEVDGHAYLLRPRYGCLKDTRHLLRRQAHHSECLVLRAAPVEDHHRLEEVGWCIGWRRLGMLVGDNLDAGSYGGTAAQELRRRTRIPWVQVDQCLAMAIDQGTHQLRGYSRACLSCLSVGFVALGEEERDAVDATGRQAMLWLDSAQVWPPSISPRHLHRVGVGQATRGGPSVGKASREASRSLGRASCHQIWTSSVPTGPIERC